MWSISRKILLIALILLAGVVHAEEEGGGEADGKKAADVPKEQKEFTEKSSKLQSLSSRIEEAEKKFTALVHEKAEAKTPEEKQAIIKEMVELTNQRNKDVENFNRIKADVELRYPNHGEALNRRYQTQSKRSVEELEGAAGLDEKLTHAKKVIDKKYAPFMEDEKAKTPNKPVAAKPEEEKKRLRLEK